METKSTNTANKDEKVLNRVEKQKTPVKKVTNRVEKEGNPVEKVTHGVNIVLNRVEKETNPVKNSTNRVERAINRIENVLNRVEKVTNRVEKTIITKVTQGKRKKCVDSEEAGDVDLTHTEESTSNKTTTLDRGVGKTSIDISSTKRYKTGLDHDYIAHYMSEETDNSETIKYLTRSLSKFSTIIAQSKSVNKTTTANSREVGDAILCHTDANISEQDNNSEESDSKVAKTSTELNRSKLVKCMAVDKQSNLVKSKNLKHEKTSSINASILSDHQTANQIEDNKIMETNIKRNTISCSSCDCTFSNHVSLASHLQDVHKISDGTKYICKICKATFAEKPDLVSHKKTVHPMKNIIINWDVSKLLKNKGTSCPICKCTFTKRLTLVNHLEHKHRIGNAPRFICRLCHATFSKKDDYVMHRKNKHSVHKCQICLQIFTRHWHLTTHMKKKHRYGCHKTKQETTELKNVDKAGGITILQRALQQCEQKGKGIKIETALKVEENVNLVKNVLVKMPSVDESSQYSGESSHVVKSLHHANVGDRTFSFPKKGKPSPFKCNICLKFFSRNWHLQNHMKSQHSNYLDEVMQETVEKAGGVTGALQCGDVGKVIKEETTFKIEENDLVENVLVMMPSVDESSQYFDESSEHVDESLQHDGGERKSSYSYTIENTSNLETPAGLDPVTQQTQCEEIIVICQSEDELPPEQFESQPGGGLEVMISNDHPSEVIADFKCDLCPMKFTARASLKRHLLKKHDKYIEPLKKLIPPGMGRECKICKYRFTTQSTLRRHFKRVHPDAYNLFAYVCHFCNEKYWDAITLRRHKLSAHREYIGQPYRCDKCNLLYESYELLTIHLNTVHPSYKHELKMHSENIKGISNCDEENRDCEETNDSDTDNPSEVEVNQICCDVEVNKDCYEIKANRNCGEIIENRDSAEKVTSNEIEVNRATAEIIKIRDCYGIEENRNCGEIIENRDCEIDRIPISDDIFINDDSGNTFMHIHSDTIKQNRDCDELKEKIIENSECRETNENSNIMENKNGKIRESTNFIIKTKNDNLKPVSCKICTKAFKKRDYLIKHMNDNHNMKLITKHACSTCDIVYLRRNHLLAHIIKCHSIKCTICNEGFATEKSLSKHVSTHLVKPTPDDLDCGLMEENADSDTAEILDVLMESYQCKKCPKVFTSEEDLINHIHATTEYMLGPTYTPTYREMNKHLCHVCGKEYPTLSNLKYHVETKHSELRRYKCEICGRGFNQKIFLENHMYTHSTERTFVCEVCGKSYFTPKTLETHMLFHSEVKPFSCTQCDKKFRRKFDLRIHTRKHTGERPYICNICGQGFIDSSRLASHRKTHKFSNKFKCDTCEANFCRNSSLVQHKLSCL